MLKSSIIYTKRLRLRPLRKDDVSFFFGAWSDPETVRYFSFAPMRCIEQAKARIDKKMEASRDGTSIICVIESLGTGEILGDCGLHNGYMQHRRAEIGGCLGPRYRGMGYMTEAISALIEYGFDQAGLNRIEAEIDPRNVPSARLVERIGFKREGYLRERWVTGGGEIADTVLYGLIQSDRYWP